MSHESNIDPTEFGNVADYLRSYRSPINYLLHVNSKDRLAPLAAELEGENANQALAAGMRENWLYVSSRNSLIIPDPKKLIDASTLPREALCFVIYLPPYYLVYTPGLFEGRLVKPSNPRETLGHRIKPK